MATTRIMSLHVGKGRTIAAAIGQTTDYVSNPDKTDDGHLISAYQCAPQTVDLEFLLAKRQYLAITGREQPKEQDVFAYHIRQSFKPGEVDPETANRIGYDLAMSFTKQNHAFIVATHIDRAHIHNHVIFNSTSLDCTRKFDDFLGSARAIRRISDQLCMERELSVIANPKRGGKHYGKWLGDRKKPSFSDQLRQAIDAALGKQPASFKEFLRLLEAQQIEVIRKGKYLKLRMPDQKRPTRCDTLRGDYTEEAIRGRIAGTWAITRKQPSSEKVNLLIDIQSKLRAGKGVGYERWGRVYNLKAMAQTLIFLQENNLLEYSELSAKAASASKRFHQTSTRIKGLEARMADNAALQKHIVNYSKTRDVYTAYRKAGYGKKFLTEHEKEIALHKAAKTAFDALGLQKLPTIKSLREDYSELLSQKKKAYAEYTQARSEMKQVLSAKANVDQILGHPDSSRGQQELDMKR